VVNMSLGYRMQFEFHVFHKGMGCSITCSNVVRQFHDCFIDAMGGENV
jgi:hypothetical protein